MPSKNPHTGRRVSGGQQRAAKRARALASSVFAELTKPPIDQGVEAVESWAAGLNLRLAVALGDADEADAKRLRAIAVVVRELGRLKDKARRAEKALVLRARRLSGERAIRLDTPPYEDPPARIPWAYAALAQEAYEAATVSTWPLRRRMRRVRVLAQSGFLPCNFAIAQLSDEVDARGG